MWPMSQLMLLTCVALFFGPTIAAEVGDDSSMETLKGTIYSRHIEDDKSCIARLRVLKEGGERVSYCLHADGKMAHTLVELAKGESIVKITGKVFENGTITVRLVIPITRAKRDDEQEHKDSGQK